MALPDYMQGAIDGADAAKKASEQTPVTDENEAVVNALEWIAAELRAQRVLRPADLRGLASDIGSSVVG